MRNTFFFYNAFLFLLFTSLLTSCGSKKNNEVILNSVENSLELALQEIAKIERQMINEYSYEFISNKDEVQAAYINEDQDFDEVSTRLLKQKESNYSTYACSKKFIKTAARYIDKIDKTVKEEDIKEKKKSLLLAKRNEVYIDLQFIYYNLDNIACIKNKKGSSLIDKTTYLPPELKIKTTTASNHSLYSVLMNEKEYQNNIALLIKSIESQSEISTSILLKIHAARETLKQTETHFVKSQYLALLDNLKSIAESISPIKKQSDFLSMKEQYEKIRVPQVPDTVVPKT